ITSASYCIDSTCAVSSATRSTRPTVLHGLFPKKMTALSICPSLVRRDGRGQVRPVETVRGPSPEPEKGDTTMRFMVIVKASKESEAGVLPSRELLAEMGKFNEELVKAGVMLAGEGLHASSKGARVRFEGKKRTVIDGPFAETKE